MVTGSVTDATKVNASLTLPQVLANKVIPAFGDEHVLSYRNLLPKNVNMDVAPGGYSGWKGASYDWAWVDRRIDLMSEVNVYGSNVWSSSGYDTGIDNRQYALFQIRPEMINSDGKGTRFDYWLKNVSNSTDFAGVGGYGDSSASHASISRGVRPRFLVG